MSARKATRRPKAPVMFTLEETGIPLGGLPEPLPCPFCGHEHASIFVDSGEHERLTSMLAQSATVACSRCGAKAAFAPNGDFPTTAEMIREAARMWNERKGGAA